MIHAPADRAGGPEHNVSRPGWVRHAVFQTAEIDPPEGRAGPLPPPEAATDLATELLNSGAVSVSWKGTVANGTFYDVYRELGDETGFTLIGSSATRRFDDVTVPAGTARAMYYTVTRRDALTSGESEPTLIRFGVQAPVPSGGTQLGLAAYSQATSKNKRGRPSLSGGAPRSVRLSGAPTSQSIWGSSRGARHA